MLRATLLRHYYGFASITLPLITLYFRYATALICRYADDMPPRHAHLLLRFLMMPLRFILPLSPYHAYAISDAAAPRLR